jgi:hypothetical protein
MNKRTRFFMLGSALVLVVGLCTGLLAYYGGLPTLASSQGSGLDELKYVPADAAVVAYANVKDVMASQFRQSIKGMMPDHDKQGQQDFERETGIDVEKDIDHIVACLSPKGAGEEPAGFVMLRGNFNDGRLEALARQHGAKIEQFNGMRVLRMEPGRNRGEAVDKDAAPGRHLSDKSGHGLDSPHVLVFVQPGLLAFGDEASVKRSLTSTGPSITSNDEIMKMISSVEGGSNLWAVGRVDALAANNKLPEQIASQLPSIKWFSASSRVDGGFTGTLRAEARDDEAAKNLRDVVQGFLALAKLQASSKPEFQSLMQSIQLTGTGRSVALSFQVPSELIQSITAKSAKPVE